MYVGNPGNGYCGVFAWVLASQSGNRLPASGNHGQKLCGKIAEDSQTPHWESDFSSKLRLQEFLLWTKMVDKPLRFFAMNFL